MMAWGPMEILMLMALGGGGQTADLASFLPADIYFRSRNIPISAESMVQLAAKKPDDGKAQIAQLLALRPLIGKFAKEKDWDKVFEVAEMVGNVRLERISFAFAEGKQAKDEGRIFLRIGGKADHQRLVETLKKLSSGTMIDESKDAKG